MSFEDCIDLYLNIKVCNLGCIDSLSWHKEHQIIATWHNYGMPKEMFKIVSMVSFISHACVTQHLLHSQKA